MAIMAGSFTLSMRRQVSIVEGIKNNARALALAESGVALAETMLLLPDENKRWRMDGNIYQIDYAGGTLGVGSKIRVRLITETGKIDINSADPKLLQSMMAHAPIEEAQRTGLVNAIIDWRDEDDLVNIDGAEKNEYKEAGLSYRPRNKPFQSIEELQLVLGITEPLYKWLEPLVTVNSGQQHVDLQQAPKEVLQVLPEIDAGMLDSFIFTRVENAGKGLPAPAFPGGTGQSSAPGQNNVVTIISEAILDDGAGALINVMVARSESSPTSPFQVMKWQRDAVGHVSLFTDEMNQLLVTEYAESEFNN
jgi:general secretion pathway protein K